ncbi:MAG: BACON domain-containing protein, partial [Terriglobia bacterium]
MEGSPSKRLTLRVAVFLFLIPFLPASNFTVASAQGIITTVAGSSVAFRGNGKSALEANLGFVSTIAADPAGNLYAVDYANHLVVKMTPGGILTVIAGNGLLGFSGDGGPATSASLNNPRGVALDGDGNLYIADHGNHRIRKVTPAGIIVTFAGDGVPRYAGDGGPAVNASLNWPFNVAFDAAGNLHVAEPQNQRVRKISAAGIITTVAGNGTPGFSGDGGPAVNASLSAPYAVAFDNAGNLYIADGENDRIRKVTPQGIIQTVAGSQRGFGGDGGPAASARLNEPRGVAVDSNNNVYIADRMNHRIRRISPDGIISTVAGSSSSGFSGDGGPANAATLLNPEGLGIDAGGTLYIGDSQNYRIRRVNAAGTIETVAGSGQYGFAGDGDAAVRGEFSFPTGVATDFSGAIYIADRNSHRIRKVSPAGVLSTVAGNGRAGFGGDGGLATAASLASPHGMALDLAGNLYVADALNHRVRKISPAGIITTVAGNGIAGFSGDGGLATEASLFEPRAVALDSFGNLYVADAFNARVRKVSAAGMITTVAGGGPTFGDGVPATSTRLLAPMGVAVDSAGNLYLADTPANRVRKVSVAGIMTTIAGGGSTLGDGGPAVAAALLLPIALAFDPSGNLYIADTYQNRIRKVTANGIISTVAGNGVTAFGGDGGLSTSASLATPFSVALGPRGDLLIADSGNQRIRQIPSIAPSFFSSPGSLRFTAPADTPTNGAQLIAVGSSLPSLVWRSRATTEDGQNWLLASPPLGASPGTIAASVNTVRLSPGNYRGRITVSAPGAVPPVQNIEVALTVQPGLPPQLLLSSTRMAFENEAGARNLASQTLQISNSGAGSLNWIAVAETTNGGNWLTISKTSGAASGAAPENLQVSTRAENLPPDVYSGSVRVRSPSTGQEIVVTVILLVTAPIPVIATSRTTLVFTGVEGGSAVPSQSVAVLNTGRGT